MYKPCTFEFGQPSMVQLVAIGFAEWAACLHMHFFRRLQYSYAEKCSKPMYTHYWARTRSFLWIASLCDHVKCPEASRTHWHQCVAGRFFRKAQKWAGQFIWAPEPEDLSSASKLLFLWSCPEHLHSSTSSSWSPANYRHVFTNAHEAHFALMRNHLHKSQRKWVC